MQLEDFRCKHRLVVRWSEVDAQRIVFNAHYMMYADVAVTEYWRQVAMPYEASWALLGGELYVKKAEVTYHAAAVMGDVLDVGIRCVKQGNTSLQFECGIFRGRQLLNTLHLVYVFADAGRTPQPVHQALRDLLTAFEAGEEMVRLESGSWNDLGRSAERLRVDVFVREQGVPPEIEMDEFDPICRHVVAFNRLNQAVGTGRLVSDAPGVGRIGRMAVARELRGSRVGRQVLDRLVEAARTRGDREVVLHAQCHAQNFYARAGFVPEGEVYAEAGIDHITMRRVL
ncbi:MULTISPECIES: GNAT family N-acetyltransferase [Comamonas]|jgi:YbgC/YbaW family acyl-CoA thioester hydrolase|uniref:4-hydroxybenzoyl-CoA thioesterase n=1 Tax=Comamonas terrigena TaxID=32013 RepID=A0A2A7UWR6_COMTR|nr:MULTISPECIES: GNAT family N-acetyltransferase [Comamonas]MBP7353288.1 GNAT family N-acetyltransferase [Comamonas sp.]MBD9531467.1 GNAT family N-acetyltransferase [Comamonas sp. CMM01]MDH0050247.1 GNAT family N-acetyltransferase [Comamonas terrigena]MDH0512620.1 GNAT family N-acetyltransferase [Comamonas terrigena]MDH1092855.1 GNAT family N-acetyltransferase [Comamonas terrigena]